MKLKYFYLLLLAICGVMTSCSDDNDETRTLGDLQVSSSYVTLNINGGKTTITVTSAADWNVVAEDVPEWLTITPMAGSAGTTEVTFSAGEGLYGQVASVRLQSGANIQEINVQQGLPTPELATCKEIIDGPEGKSFRVKGTVKSIANTTYGNWYLQDETGEVYIYGTLDKDGKTKNFSSLGIEVGDVVTVEGPKKLYNGTVELVDVTVVNIEKTLVKILSGNETTVGKAGGELKIEVEYKGIGLVPTIAPDCNWIHFVSMSLTPGTPSAIDPNPASKAVVLFNVDANASESRTGIITFESSQLMENNETGKQSVYSSTLNYTVKQETAITNPAKGDGSKANPYNVPAVLEYVNGLGADVKSESDVYVEGIISSIKYTYSAQFGTATYNISVDGNEENIFTVYGSYFFDNKPWEEGQTQIQVGDKVVVCGKVINYKGTTPEFSNKENWLVSLNGVTGEGGEQGNAEAGTQGNPYDVEAVVAVASKLEAGQTTEEDCYFKGKISSIKYTFDAQHGTATFFVSNDGSAESTQFQVYSTYYLGNRAWADGDKQIAVGDEVVICGKLTNYNGTLETASKKSYLYSLNGATN